MTQQISHHPAAWIERLARFGYASKGAVYFLVGLLAVQAAFGPGGEKTGTEGALKTLVKQPFGQLLLGLVAFGLISYAMWRFVEAANGWVYLQNRSSGLNLTHNGGKKIVLTANNGNNTHWRVVASNVNY